MASSEPARRTIHRTTGRRRMRRMRVAALLVMAAAVVAVVADGFRDSPSSTVRPAAGVLPSSAAPAPLEAPRGAPRVPGRALGEADGAVPSGTTVFDGAIPGVANLDPALLAALRRAATDAAADGVGFVVDSGWRSPAYQEHLLREAVATYGSEAEAARWVATPQTSAHVSGDAIDIGPSGAADWLGGHGAAYGLCRIYDNEPWHYELRPQAPRLGCPPTYADPTQDPRMRP